MTRTISNIATYIASCVTNTTLDADTIETIIDDQIGYFNSKTNENFPYLTGTVGAKSISGDDGAIACINDLARAQVKWLVDRGPNVSIQGYSQQATVMDVGLQGVKERIIQDYKQNKYANRVFQRVITS